MGPEIINFWTNFGMILGAILGPELAPKGDQKWDHFWNPSAPALRGRNDVVLPIKQEWWNCYGYWNYTRQLDKRKGGIVNCSVNCSFDSFGPKQGHEILLGSLGLGSAGLPMSRTL